MEGSCQGHHIPSLPWTGGYHQGGIGIGREDLPFIQKPLPALCDGTGAPKLKDQTGLHLESLFPETEDNRNIAGTFPGARMGLVPQPDISVLGVTDFLSLGSAGQDGIPRTQKSYQRVPWEAMSHDSGSPAPALVISLSSPDLYGWKGTSRPYLNENGNKGFISAGPLASFPLILSPGYATPVH